MRLCVRCGAEVHAKRRDARYCSDNCRKRTSAEKHRARCTDCGRPLQEGTTWRGTERCRACHFAFLSAGQTRRRRTIQLMWEDGYSMREIAEVLGIDKVALGVEMARMRNDGWELPYRYEHAPGAIERARERTRALRAAEKARKEAA